MFVVLALSASCTAANSQAAATGGHRLNPSTIMGPGSSPLVRSAASVPSTSPGAPAGTDQLGWTPISYGRSAVAVDQRSVGLADGRDMVVTRFHPTQVVFDLHIGTGDPPAGRAVLNPQSASRVSDYERPLLLAAFNGGFKANADAGGVEVDGQDLTPLVGGLAAFVIDTNGVAHIGRWGQDLPYSREHVASVRENLAPLITSSRVNPLVDDFRAWGSTIGGGAVVARSAVGEDAAGNILYTGNMHANPADLADALLASGATSAMQLDINPEWIQLVLANSPGGTLRTAITGQNRPAMQVVTGWTRDFITVLVR